MDVDSRPILCTRGGKPATAADLAAVEAFADFLRDAGPAGRADRQRSHQDQQQPEQRVDDKPEKNRDDQ